MVGMYCNMGLRGATIALMLGTAWPATAQTAASSPPSEELETIVVTAERTKGDLQKTPISVTAISAEGLAKSNIRSIADLDKLVPGLTIGQTGAYPLNLTIRGVGVEGPQNGGSSPSVAVVQNGIFINNAEISFFDMDQVEVLRGPQGTLNGQNAVGGVLNLTTGLADTKGLRVSGEASYGSFNYDRVRGVANLPLSDTFAVRVAVQHEGHDGWVKSPNLSSVSRAGDQDSWAGRVSALWQPIERLSVTVWSEYFGNDQNSVGIRNMIDPIPDRRTTSASFKTPQLLRSRIAAGTAAYDLDFATLKSLTSFQRTKTKRPSSGDYLTMEQAVDIYGVQDQLPVIDGKSRTFTQEFNLASNNNDTFKWIIGAFYLRSRDSSGVLEIQQATPIPYAYTVAPTPAEKAQQFAAGLSFQNTSDRRRRSVAGYGQIAWQVAEQLRLTGGLRYSWDKTDSSVSPYYRAPNLSTSHFKKVTVRAVAEYELAQRSRIYASYATGVKPGGANASTTPLVIPTTFAKETLQAYEIGTKNEIFNRRLRLNGSAFFTNYKDMQTPSEDPRPYQGGLTNIPKTHIYGIEGEATLILPKGFQVNANAAWTKSKVISDFFALDPYLAQSINRRFGIFTPLSLAGRAAAVRNYKGNEVGRTPPFSTSVAVNKTSELGNLGTLDLFVQGSYRSAFDFRVFNNPLTDRVPKQYVMNLNARLDPANSPLHFELQITNLTGSDRIQSRFAEAFGVGAVFDVVTPPRQFIGRVGFDF
jgi:iron complex outermembrane receptor protein